MLYTWLAKYGKNWLCTYYARNSHASLPIVLGNFVFSRNFRTDKITDQIRPSFDNNVGSNGDDDVDPVV